MSPLTAAPAVDARLGIVLAVLILVTLIVSLKAHLNVARDQVEAAVRSVLQLGLVSLVIAAALTSVGWSLGFALLMLLVATTTSTRRLHLSWRDATLVGASIAIGVAPVVGLCLASGVVPLNGAGIIPIAGIVTGGAMTAATLTGRRAFYELDAQRGTYEAGLSLGLPAADAARLVLRDAAREALIPGIDQTRTVGLVTLPGAFVGVLLGGGTALEAGAAQILVLFGLLAAQSLTAATILRLIAGGVLLPSDLRTLPR